MKKTILSVLCLTGLTAVQMAGAVTISAVIGGGAIGDRFVNFDNLPSGGGTATGPTGSVGVSIAGSAAVVTIPDVSGVYAAPFLSGSNGVGFGNPGNQPIGQDTTKYLSAGSTGANAQSEITLSFSTPQNYLGLLWGSVDTYNTLNFYDGTLLLLSITGSQILNPADGNQQLVGTAYVNITGLPKFDSVTAVSSQYAFEFDNVSYGNVPDGGATIGLFGLGLIGLTAVSRRMKAKK